MISEAIPAASIEAPANLIPFLRKSPADSYL